MEIMIWQKNSSILKRRPFARTGPTALLGFLSLLRPFLVATALILSAFALLLSSFFASSAQAVPDTAVVLDIKGPIGPAVSDYIVRSIEQAPEDGTPLIILRMDTPGGLDSSMRDIIKAILASPIPVAGFVSPSGARAASAGTYILYACHVAAMSPGTNLGAATPVQIGGMPNPASPDKSPAKSSGKSQEDKEGASEEDSKAHPSLADKAVNDAAAYIRSLAEMRGRNAEWGELAVREAVSLSAEKAVENKVVDILARDIAELLEKMDGRTVQISGQDQVLATRNLETAEIAPDWRTEFLAVITNPSVAYILLMIGIYGLIIEFWNPGTVLPGVTGAISLLLALYALQLLPVNYAGLALILLGLVLLIAEMFVPAFGILGFGGLVALVIGSVILIDTDVPGMTMSMPIVGSFAFVSGLLLLGIMYMAVKAWHRPVTMGPESLIGEYGEVIDWQDGAGHVRVQGEIWQAQGPAELSRRNRVKVTGLDGLKLFIERDNGNNGQEHKHDV
ncbi:NfeD family protein [Luteithermobacter gelatinilyticus]|uniref:NfeD family protein n=1 Tax=Luteithermobacter gelatinilyticus TaxID=2582913 RepID=UPI001AEF4EAF|nr:nodulation protein NfeD [Luteithermobacter gelatinilyticus]